MNTRTAYSGAISPRSAATVAGLGLLLMAVVAPLASFGVLQKLIVMTDPAATVANIAASSGLFRLGIAGFVGVAVLDVLVAWGLYGLLEPANRSLSMLAAWFRVAYAAVFLMALNPLWSVLQLVSSKTLEGSQLQAQILISLNAFQSGWDLALILFGFHLLVLGFVAYQSGHIPKWLGVLLLVAALGYLMDSFGKLLIPGYHLTISAVTFLGEFLLIFWLLWKGVKGFDETTSRPLLQS